MATRRVVTWMVLLGVGGCASAFTDPASIAGEYRLTRVDDELLPCCTQTDSTGTTVTIVGGALTLGEAAPENYVYTPAGIPMARSCVHEVPNGAMVGRDGWVTLPDGSRYRIPECGDGDYTMAIIWRHERADGTSDTVSETTSGRYTWGNDPSGAEILSLVGAGGLGTVTASDRGVDIALTMGVRVGPAEALGPRYEFHQAAR